MAASADEPEDANFVRKHALAFQAERGCDLETAALRVFSNAEGAYGANVGMLIDSGAWSDEDEISNTFASRKGFAYSRKGVATEQRALLGMRAEARSISPIRTSIASNSASPRSTSISTASAASAAPPRARAAWRRRRSTSATRRAARARCAR